ncbi:MAG: RiPP maturation radical SAM protein 1 [Bryobacteraceae bacterium]|nr:RiPP maturation radical SAM protein 1 [Bryobacteraceae bacterium]
MPSQAAPANPSALLISLPWTALAEPSLGLGILRSVLDTEGIPCRVWHLNIFMLRYLQALTYYSIANVFSLNDFLFSGVIERKLTRPQERWLRIKAVHLINLGFLDSRANNGTDGVIAELLRLRDEVIPAFLHECAEEVARSPATLVGFTCMFDQTVASLALAKLIREKCPDKMIVLGGYAVRSPTAEALMRSFPWVDAICAGEGENVIGELARASAGLKPLADVQGIFVRSGDGSVHATSAPPSVDMNSSPFPNYDDFYQDLRDLAERDQVTIEVERLPIENSRGCWWGAKHHCTFCGIHDDDMAFRSRDAGRVLECMDTLSARYNIRHFRFADYILPNGYYDTLLPELARRGRPYRITCEMKANVNAHRFRTLARSGIAEAQPGIESFASDVLRHMDKGVTATGNVYTLVLGKRHGVFLHYNLIYGFPSDRENDYKAMVRALPRLVHLDPPSTHLEVQITRYAPLQQNPERYGITRSTHESSYELIFSKEYRRATGFDLDDFCYYFNRPFENAPRLRPLYRQIDDFVEQWRALRSGPREIRLSYEPFGDGLRIVDSRTVPECEIFLDREETSVYLAVLAPISVEALSRKLCGSVTSDRVSRILLRLDELGLIFRENEQLVALALPSTPETDDVIEPLVKSLPGSFDIALTPQGSFVSN